MVFIIYSNGKMCAVTGYMCNTNIPFMEVAVLFKYLIVSVLTTWFRCSNALLFPDLICCVILSFLVLDTAAGVWCDTKSVVTTPRTGRYSADAAGGEASGELTRRCRHAAAAVGDMIFIYGGLRGGKHLSFFASSYSRCQVSYMNFVLCPASPLVL